MQPNFGSSRVKIRDKPVLTVSGVHQYAYEVGTDTLKQDNLIPDFVVGTDHESIIYGTRLKPYKGRSNYCVHTHNVFSYGGGVAPQNFGASPVVTSITPNWYWKYYQNHHRVCCDVRDTIVGLFKTAAGGNFGPAYLGAHGLPYINAAFDRMRPDLTSVSIPNFLLDIEDLTKIYKQWKEHLSVAKNLARAAGIDRRSKSRSVAGVHLGYKFGWKPTVGDIHDMIEGVIHLRAKLAAFNAQLGKIIQSSTVMEHGTTAVSGTYRIPGSALATWHGTVRRECRAFIAYGPQPLAVMGPMDMVLRGLLDSLGFELNPRIIWDAIPFSFVIDWFFGVGSWLQRFRVDALELPITLVDAFLQYKETVNIEWVTLSDHLVGYVPSPQSAGATFNGDFFHRMPIFPDYATLSGLGWKMPSLNQAALLVSLGTVLRKR